MHKKSIGKHVLLTQRITGGVDAAKGVFSLGDILAVRSSDDTSSTTSGNDSDLRIDYAYQNHFAYEISDPGSQSKKCVFLFCGTAAVAGVGLELVMQPWSASPTARSVDQLPPYASDVGSVTRNFDGAGTAHRTAFTNYVQQMHRSVAAGSGEGISHPTVTLVAKTYSYMQDVPLSSSIPSLLKCGAWCLLQ